MSQDNIFEFMKSVPPECWMSTNAIREGLVVHGWPDGGACFYRKLSQLIKYGILASYQSSDARKKYYRLKRPEVAYRFIEHYMEIMQVPLVTDEVLNG